METYLKIIVSGAMESFDDLAGFAELLRRLSDEYGLHRALLDQRRLHMRLDTLDVYRLAESEVSAEAAVRGVRIACLPNSEDSGFARNMETIMHNRSISYRVFADEDEAVAWLTR
jgi:hypothetical protein